jgi:hypothetical protein
VTVAWEAADLFAGVLEKRKSVFGPERGYDQGDGRSGRCLTDKCGGGKVGREAWEFSRVLGDKDPTMAILLYNLGAVAGVRDRTDEAITLLNQAIDVGRRRACQRT